MLTWSQTTVCALTTWCCMISGKNSNPGSTSPRVYLTQDLPHPGSTLPTIYLTQDIPYPGSTLPRIYLTQGLPYPGSTSPRIYLTQGECTNRCGLAYLKHCIQLHETVNSKCLLLLEIFNTDKGGDEGWRSGHPFLENLWNLHGIHLLKQKI